MKHIEKMYNNIKCDRKNIHFMRKPKMQWMLFTALVLMSSSCNNYEVFEKEQYKNVFALISGSGNVSSKYHPLGGETVGYVAASLGGTSPTNKDIKFYLLLTIDDAGKVTISPYKNAEVTQINDDTFYSNTFFIEDDGFNTYKNFRLKYQYKSGDKTYEFREELRLQFNADEEAEEELAG